MQAEDALAYLRRDLAFRAERDASARYVLEHGKPFVPSQRPKGLRKRRNRYCFANAASVVGDYPDLGYRYCEGWAVSASGHSLAIQHAWLTVDGSTAVDVTWLEPGLAYLGVMIESAELARCQLAVLSHSSYLDWVTDTLR